MTREEAISLIKSAQLMLINPTTNEPVSDLYEALEMAIKALEKENIYDDKEHYVTISKALYDKLNIDYEQALSQEPNRDIKEIAEIMKCDVDAETKCKMISNILTAKPHYFEEQDPCETCGYAEGSPFCLQYCPYDAEIKKEQEPTEKPMTVDEMEREYEKSKALFHKIVECDDAISRQAVLDIVCGAYEKDGWGESNFYKTIEQLPSVTQKSGKWIPVSERLPEEFESVLVCYKSQGGMAQAVSERFGTHTGYRWSALAGIEPIAWMPLPKPYEPQESEKINCKSTKCENCTNHNYCDYEPQESEVRNDNNQNV